MGRASFTGRFFRPQLVGVGPLLVDARRSIAVLRQLRGTRRAQRGRAIGPVPPALAPLGPRRRPSNGAECSGRLTAAWMARGPSARGWVLSQGGPLSGQIAQKVRFTFAPQAVRLLAVRGEQLDDHSQPHPGDPGYAAAHDRHIRHGDRAARRPGDGGRVDAGRRAARRILRRGGGGPVRRTRTAGLRERRPSDVRRSSSSAVPGTAGRARRRYATATATSLDVSLRISLLQGQDGAARWLASVTDVGALSGEASSGSVRESLLDRAPIGVVIRDPQLRCTWVNDAMERHDGIPRDRRLGRRLTDALPAVEAEALEAVMRQVLKSGTTKVHEYRTWLPTGRRGSTRSRSRSPASRARTARALGVCAISVDVTESRRARERLAVLERGRHAPRQHPGRDADRAGTGRPCRAPARRLRRRRPGAVGPVRRGAPGPHRRDGRAPPRSPPCRSGLDPTRGSRNPRGMRGEVVPVPPGSPFTAVLRTGQVPPGAGRWTPLRAPGSTTTRRGRRRSARHGIHSLMIVPIRARRALLGVALFVRTENPVPFQEVDLLLAEELVSRAALVVGQRPPVRARAHRRPRAPTPSAPPPC